MTNKKIILILSLFVAFILAFFVAAKIYKSHQLKKISFLASENAAIFLRDQSVKLGPEKAEVYLVEFLDPECESCRNFHPLLKSILSEFDGRVQLIVRYAAFHANSVFAIKILEAARNQNKYWETLQILYDYQDYWGGHHDPKPELIWHYLPKIGLDIEKIRSDMNDVKIMSLIEQDQKDGQALGVNGTPTFFINGRPLEEFSYQYLREQIAQELAKN
jgi:protein-disulfide isomerase